MTALLFALVVLSGVLIASRMGLPRVNVVAVFGSVFVPLTVLASAESVLSPSMSSGTWTVLFLALVASIVGCSLGAIQRTQSANQNNSFGGIDSRLIIKAHIVCCALLGAYLTWQLYLLPQRFGFGLKDILAALFGSAGAGGLRNDLITEQTNLEGSGLGVGGLIQGLVSFVLFLGHVGIFTGACLWVLRKRFLAIIPLIISAVLSTLLLQRYTALMAMTFFAFAVIASKHALLRKEGADESPRLNKGGVWRVLMVAGVVAIGVIVTLVPLAARLRTGGGRSATQTLLPYLLHGLGGLNCSDLTAADGPVTFDASLAAINATAGANSFKDLFIVLKRLGFSVDDAPRGYLDFAHRCTFDVLGRGEPSFVYTPFFDYWLDFGLGGVFFISLIIAYIGTRAQLGAWNGRISAVPLYSFVMGITFWSFSANYLLGSLRYTLLVIVSTVLLRQLEARSVVSAGKAVAIPNHLSSRERAQKAW